jgi:hypothetical protein
MIIHHESTTYYPQGNGHTKWANKILKQILTKVINVNQNDWDVMLIMASWAYQMAYRITTRHSPYELIYGLMLLLPIKVLIATNWMCVKWNENMKNALLIQMEDLFYWMKNIIARKNMSYIRLLWKHQQDDDKNL